jgi:hypothetical protein
VLSLIVTVLIAELLVLSELVTVSGGLLEVHSLITFVSREKQFL